MKTLDDLRSKVIKDISQPTGALIAGIIGSHPLTDFLVEYYKDEHKDKVVTLSEENIIKLMQKDIRCAIKSTNENVEFVSLLYLWKFMSFMWVLDDKEIIDMEYKSKDSKLELFNIIAKKYGLDTEKKE